MSLNGILEIVISLAAIFWLLSMISSFLVEAWNSILKNVRGDTLERFICEMILGQDKVRNMLSSFRGKLSSRMSADPLGLLSHGLIESLRAPKIGASGEGTAPSYVPADAFAKALLDRLASLAPAVTLFANLKWVDLQAVLNEASNALGGQQSSLSNLLTQLQQNVTNRSDTFAVFQDVLEHIEKLKPTEAQNELQTLINLLSQLSIPPNSAAATAREYLTNVLQNARSAIGALNLPATESLSSTCNPDTLWLIVLREMGSRITTNTNVLDSLRSVIDKAPLPLSLREALRPIVANANFDLTQIRKGIEVWYESVMERASGWFKRHTTAMLFGVGTAMAIGFNINPILITGDLAKDPALRSSGVAFGQTIVEQKGDSALAQKIFFAEAAKRMKWKERIDKIAIDATATSSSDRQALTTLAYEIQPLLLRNGQFVGLLPKVDSWVAQAGSQFDESEIKHFTEALCRAHLDAGAAEKNRFSGSQNNESASRKCETLLKPFSIVKTSRERARAFLGNEQIVWDIKLGSALLEARITIAEAVANKPQTFPEKKEKETAEEKKKREDAEKLENERVAKVRMEIEEKLNTLRLALESAITSANKVNASANDYLSRIPSLWWEGKFANKTGGEIFFYLVCSVAGWILTGLMVSFGAAFWFDLLSKLVNRRVTGPKPAADTTT